MFCRVRSEGGAVLGEEAASPPSPSVRGFGECCKLSQWGSWRSPGRSAICLYFEVSRQRILLRY